VRGVPVERVTQGLAGMAKGTVKWFNTEKGFGFIQPADGGKDIFVHITAVQAAGLQTLQDDQSVEYELIDGRDGRKSAGNLRV
jgi:CspA family cold shock protein